MAEPAGFIREFCGVVAQGVMNLSVAFEKKLRFRLTFANAAVNLRRNVSVNNC